MGLQRLWPENPTYQVYVPGYHSTMPQQHLNGRARSVSPQEVQVASLSDHPRANSRGGILYAELQFPVTSNYGSMKNDLREIGYRTVIFTVPHLVTLPPLLQSILENLHLQI